ncbi:MAG TPA: hypothetical protein VEY09_05690 [Pyrinomonadaceae bacterium]|nr:hypothetical protein [Pyrinomonadaceae bacterium]
MNRTDKLRLLRKFTLFVVLLAGLAFASSDFGVKEAGAAPCCSECEDKEEYCYTLPDPGPCLNDNTRCWRWCSFSC